MFDTPETAVIILKFLREKCEGWNVKNAPMLASEWKLDRNVPLSTLPLDGWVWREIENKVVIDTECEWIDREALHDVADLGSLRYRVFVSKAREGSDDPGLFLAWVTSEDDTEPFFISLQPD